MTSLIDFIKALFFMGAVVAVLVGATIIGTFVVPIIGVTFLVYVAYKVIQKEI